MDEVEVPQFFLCPISLQIMKDPVTAVSGITYERESMEHWLLAARNPTCPVTKQPLPRDSDLTPNHTLRRLIQAWCVANARNGVERIPTPKPPLTKSLVFKLIRDLDVPKLHMEALKKLEEIAEDDRNFEKNRVCMAEAGVVEAMVSIITRFFMENETSGIEEALKILHLVWKPNMESKQLVRENFDLIESLLWVLRFNNQVAVKTHAILVLRQILEVASSGLLERLRPQFFNEVVKVLRDLKACKKATKAALHVLTEVCPWGRNRAKIVEAGAVFELIELELSKPEKRVTELIFCLLARLCSCADGRAEFLKHAGSVAMVSKRILRVSPATDNRAIQILTLVARSCATQEVVMEMLRVGAVSKLCMVLQANCEKFLKNKAREVLRMHSNVWNNSPCIAVYLLTKDPR